jgi:SH3-like domain-containing protein
MLATAIAAPVGSQTTVPQTVMARGPAISIPTRQVQTIQANVRSAPSMSGPVVRTLMRGQMVQALQTENGWTRVAEQGGEPIGWMHNSVLK